MFPACAWFPAGRRLCGKGVDDLNPPIAANAEFWPSFIAPERYEKPGFVGQSAVLFPPARGTVAPSGALGKSSAEASFPARSRAWRLGRFARTACLDNIAIDVGNACDCQGEAARPGGASGPRATNPARRGLNIELLCLHPRDRVSMVRSCDEAGVVQRRLPQGLSIPAFLQSRRLGEAGCRVPLAVPGRLFSRPGPADE